MINQKDEALKMAINVLELYEEKLNSSIAIEVIQACKEALEQPTNMVTIPLDKLEDMQRRLKEQPISHSCRSDGVCKCEQPTKEEILGKVFDAVYAQYPKKEWQGLSDEEILDIKVKAGLGNWYDFSHAIEAKLKEKNHA